MGITSAAITYPLDLHLHSISTTPPYIHSLAHSSLHLDPSTTSTLFDTYNLSSRACHPPENSGIGLTSPPCSSKTTRGFQSYISKAILQAGVEVVHGRQSNLYWVLRAPTTLPWPSSSSGFPLTTADSLALQKEYPSDNYLKVENVDIIFLKESLGLADLFIPFLQSLKSGWKFHAVDLIGPFEGLSLGINPHTIRLKAS